MFVVKYLLVMVCVLDYGYIVNKVMIRISFRRDLILNYFIKCFLCNISVRKFFLFFV